MKDKTTIKIFPVIIGLTILLVVALVIYAIFFISTTSTVDDSPSKQNFDDDWNGQSHRLGNVLDAWYFGVLLGSTIREKEFDQMTRDATKGNINSFLRDLSNPEQYLSIPTTDTRTKILTDAADEFWASYFYENLQLAQPEMRDDLRKVVEKYVATYPHIRNSLAFKGGPTHCLIHFRVGDFITLGNSISTESLVEACTTLPTKPTVFEILNSGKNFQGDLTQSQNVLAVLKNQLADHFPDAEIIFAPELSPDEDFIKMMYAPLLVTAGGSFAILGALLSSATSIRTPACSNLNFCEIEGQDELLSQIDHFTHTDWTFYKYDKLN